MCIYVEILLYYNSKKSLLIVSITIILFSRLAVEIVSGHKRIFLTTCESPTNELIHILTVATDCCQIGILTRVLFHKRARNTFNRTQETQTTLFLFCHIGLNTFILS